MRNENLVEEWLAYAKMDLETALHLHSSMVPEPLEIVCYHCQQYAEKTLKAMLIGFGLPVSRTHDLGLLASQLEPHLEVPEDILDACDNLSPYGVKVRYPREILIEDVHVKGALHDAGVIREWSNSVLSRE